MTVNLRRIRQQNNTLCLDGGFEVLTAITLKSTIFWDTTPCSQINTDVSGSILVLQANSLLSVFPTQEREAIRSYETDELLDYTASRLR
jgi:hypothetical protein